MNIRKSQCFSEKIEIDVIENNIKEKTNGIVKIILSLLYKFEMV